MIDNTFFVYDAYSDGYNAYMKGMDNIYNPYVAGSDEYWAWMDGWDDASLKHRWNDFDYIGTDV
jgi:hypothetical protein